MSSLNRLAEQLISPSLSHQAITDSLRALGFRASVFGLRQVLVVSSSLDPYFLRLETYFPNAKKLLEDFRRSGEILAILDSATAFPTNIQIQSKYDATSFCAAIGGKNYQPVDFEQCPALAELLAFLWLANSCVHTQTNPPLSEKLAKLLGNSIIFAEILAYDVEDFPDLISTEPVSLNEDPSGWISLSSSLFELNHPNVFNSDDVREGLAEACDLIRQHIYPAQICSELEDPTRPAMQRGASLEERERLTVHHNSFHESELKTLSKELRAIIEQGDKYKLTGFREATPPYFFEAVIVSLALATGRTIRGAIELSLQSTSQEHIHIRLLPGFENNFYYPFWSRTLAPKTKLELALPEILRCLCQAPIRFNEASTLGECLPYSYTNWEDRCFIWLEQHLKGHRSGIDRKIRDALPRVLYQGTANNALLKWISTPIERIDYQVESLSYYLEPISEQTVDAYTSACQKLFGAYGANKEVRYSTVPISTSRAAKNRPAVSKIFLDDLQSAEKTNDLITYHNALARYVLMLLVVATGHRRSATPFFFPWDVLDGENLVFICDKLTIGSEARFVPIPTWVSELVKDYHKHLRALAQYLRSKNIRLACEIEDLINGNIQSCAFNEESSAVQADRRSPAFGQFFLIGQDFTAKTIKTRDLENIYEHALPEGVRHFRRRIANSLWIQGLSGYQIEAFLGHNADLHCFGESSAWSIIGWARTVQTAQEAYLSEGGWHGVTNKGSAKLAHSAGACAPNFQKSSLGYEGRAISNDAARARARKIVRDLLPAEWFSNEHSNITDSDIAALKEHAKERLVSDPESSQKIEHAIAEVVKQLRGVVGRGISSTLANLKRIEAGPIEVTSSRHYAIALATREWWVGRLGSYSVEAKENYMDRLASIGISLVIFDAVLDKTDWQLLLSSIARHESQSVHGCLIVRAQVDRQSRGYDKTIVLSPYTAAQIVGFENLHSQTLYEERVVNSITNRIEKWLKGAPHSGKSLSFVKLIAIFRVWWMLRLSGTENAIAIGDYSGPAPDLVSEGALYGVNTADVSDTSLSTEVMKFAVTPNYAPSSAKNLINALLRDAKGRFELKQQTNRRQRNRLLRLLNDSHEHVALKLLSNQKPVVSAMLGFLQYLLEEGGKRVDVYAFGSLGTFYSHINKLVDTWWEKSLDELEPEDYDEAYAALLRNSDQAAYPIWLFHKFLREIYGAPPSSVASAFRRTTIYCRSALIPVGQFDKAWENTRMLDDDGQIISHSRTYLVVGYQYGLRSREILGLNSDTVLQPKPFMIRVERNNVRDLKTKLHALRVVHPLLASSKYQRHLEQISALCANAPSKNHSLFADHRQRDALYSKSRISQAATFALRAATGNLSVVSHSMRHSAATRLAHFSLRPPRSIPLSTYVEKAMQGDIKSDTFTACFDQGFYAWPFWTDRAAMFLGHSSVDTLLNTYWHTSHIRLAEQTWNASESVDPTIQQIAHMLGKERTRVNKQLSSLSKAQGDEAARIKELLVAYHVSVSKIPMLGTDQPNDVAKTGFIHTSVDQLGSHECSDQWVAFDRLLCRRLAADLSFDEARAISEQFDLSRTSVDAFLKSYVKLVLQLGFDYFEPDNSELVKAKSRNSRGTIRGAGERERSIATARALVSTSESFSPKLENFINLWIDRVDSESPWLIARDINELQLIMEILISMGAARDQFEFANYGFKLTFLRGILTQSEIASITQRKTRLSSGPRNTRIAELGVRIGQKQGAKIGDYRDTHRLLLVLAAIIRTNGL